MCNLKKNLISQPLHWDGAFDHQKQMFKLMDKKIFTNLHSHLYTSMFANAGLN